MTTQPTDTRPDAIPQAMPGANRGANQAAIPATGAAPLILTLQLGEPAQSLFQALRNRHFPRERNVVPAHVSLFHALPGSERGSIVRVLRALEADRPPVQIEAPRPLGRGVAFPLASPDLQALRGRLADAWSPWLTPQDRQRFSPHVTVQNKVTPAEAAATLDRLQQGFVPWRSEGVALLLWRYLDGPWEALERFELHTPTTTGQRS